MNELSDDIDALLEKLDQPITTPPESPKKVGPTPDELLDELESMEMPDVLRPVEQQLVVEQNEVAQVADSAIEIAEYRDQLRTVTHEVLDSARSDRAEAQDVIDMLRALVVNQGNAPSKACVDGLVKAVEVKANIQQNAIKIMEVNAKFLASTKSSMTVKNNLHITPDELNNILETSATELD